MTHTKFSPYAKISIIFALESFIAAFSWSAFGFFNHAWPKRLQSSGFGVDVACGLYGDAKTFQCAGHFQSEALVRNEFLYCGSSPSLNSINTAFLLFIMLACRTLQFFPLTSSAVATLNSTGLRP